MKRFDVIEDIDAYGDSHGWYKEYSHEGEYIKYADVQSLQAELAQFKAAYKDMVEKFVEATFERDRLREALENVHRINDSALYSHNQKRSAIGDIARKALKGGEK